MRSFWQRKARRGGFILGNVITRSAACLVFALLASLCYAADPRAGLWSLISAQSSLDPPNKLTIASTAGLVHVSMTGEDHFDFTAKTNGRSAAVPANPLFDEVELHRVGRNEVDIVEKKNGAVTATVNNVLSRNKREMTLTIVRVGQPDQISVWKRNGSSIATLDPFAGSWTEDVSKTNMVHAVPLRIEAIGSDGVRFSFGYSYTAHLDGKLYPLQGSRNDFVKLSQVDAHTVDAVYLRDQKVTQVDHWSVAPDGRTMTVTSSGRLETGQQFTDKLIFQRKN